MASYFGTKHDHDIYIAYLPMRKNMLHRLTVNFLVTVSFYPAYNILNILYDNQLI